MNVVRRLVIIIIGYDTKGNKNKGYFKRPFYCWDIPTSSKMMPLCCLQNNKNGIWACSEQTVTHTVLWHSLKESLFCMEYNPFCFKSVWAGKLKLWSLLYMHAKVHKNAVDTMVTCSYKWLTNNICVSFMKLEMLEEVSTDI